MSKTPTKQKFATCNSCGGMKGDHDTTYDRTGTWVECHRCFGTGLFLPDKFVKTAIEAALQSAADTPPDIDQVATRIASKYLTLDISCERLYHDVVEALTAERAGASRKAAADTPAPEYHHVGWVHSFPSPRFGVETFFSQFEPTGNVDWLKVYVRAPREDRL